MKPRHRRQYQFEGGTQFAQIFLHFHEYNQKRSDVNTVSVTKKKQKHKDLT